MYTKTLPVNRSTIFLALLFSALAAVLFVRTNPRPPHHHGYAILSWKELNGFTDSPSPQTLPRLFPSDGAAVSWKEAGSTTKTRRAESDWFVIEAPIIEFAAAGALDDRTSKKPTVAVVSDTGEVFADETLPLTNEILNDQGWNARRIKLPPEAVGRKAQVIFRTKAASARGAWFAVRERIDFYEDAPYPAAFGSGPVSLKFFGAAILLALLGGLLIDRFSTGEPGRRVQFIFFLALGTLFQFHPAVYYYWDEWDILARFHQLGPAGIFYTHNEHFLPLFFGWYYLLIKIFGAMYLPMIAISVCLHALNAVLLVAILRRLGGGTMLAERAALLLGVLFTINCLHAETLQWAFEQCILICELLTLTSFFLCWRFIGRRDWKFGVLAAGAALIAPLFFGNGFSLPLQAAIFMVLGPIAICAQDEHVSRFRYAPRLGIFLALSTVFAGAAAFLYHLHPGNAAPRPPIDSYWDFASQLAQYLWVGTELGAILRGIGLFPGLSLGSASYVAGKLDLTIRRPDLLFAGIGFVVSIAALVVGAYYRRNRREAVRLWLMGWLIALACLALPALGRASLGVDQSLSPRYHYATLVGVCIMLLPCFMQLLEWGGSYTAKEKSFAARAAIPFAIAVIFLSHFLTTRFFDYFTARGFEHRVYLEELEAWQKQLRDAGVDPASNYEAAGTALAQMHPTHRHTITPAQHPNEIYSLYKSLRFSE